MSHVIALRAVAGLWIAWGLYWLVMAANVKATAWHESLASQARHRVPLMLAILLLVAPRFFPDGFKHRFVVETTASLAAGVMLTAAGVAFSIWARRVLGRNWSANVTRKSGHALVRVGPYRIVRHPVYTGVVTGLLGSALAIGEWRGLLAAALAFVAFLLKLRTEERVMSETFPEYAEYRTHTAAIIPFVL